jgi:hypothetical protein
MSTQTEQQTQRTIAKIVKVFDNQAPKGPWLRVVTDDGTSLSLWKNEFFDAARQAKQNGDYVEIEWFQNGEYKNIAALRHPPEGAPPADAPAPAPAARATGGSNGNGRDKGTQDSIEWQTCVKAAGEVVAGIGSNLSLTTDPDVIGTFVGQLAAAILRERPTV